MSRQQGVSINTWRKYLETELKMETFEEGGKMSRREWWESYDSYWNKFRDYKKIKEILYGRKINRVLDVGGGRGWDLEVFNEWVEKYVVDPLWDKYVGMNEENQKVKGVVGQGESLPFKDSFFDAVISMNALDHVVDMEKVLQEIYRVLRDDGLFVLSVDCNTSPLDYVDAKEPHTYIFRENEIREKLHLLGFKLINSYHSTIPCSLSQYYKGGNGKESMFSVGGRQITNNILEYMKNLLGGDTELNKKESASGWFYCFNCGNFTFSLSIQPAAQEYFFISEKMK